MYPTLFEVGDLTITTFGLMMLLAFAAGAWAMAAQLRVRRRFRNVPDERSYVGARARALRAWLVLMAAILIGTTFPSQVEAARPDGPAAEALDAASVTSSSDEEPSDDPGCTPGCICLCGCAGCAIRIGAQPTCIPAASGIASAPPRWVDQHAPPSLTHEPHLPPPRT